MDYRTAHRLASEKYDPTNAETIGAYWVELKRLESLPAVDAAEAEAEASSVEWVVFGRENDAGRMVYTAQHGFVDGAAAALCGRVFDGEAMAPQDTPSDRRCKRCAGRSATA